MASFTSYINDEDNFNAPREPNQLSGDVVIGRAKNVALVNQYFKDQDKNHTVVGNLYCTLFKAAFVTLAHNGLNVVKDGENKLLADENEFPLASISAVYHVSKGKRKKLLPNVVLTDSKLKKVEIHCKDFRQYFFNFKNTPKDDQRKVLHAILHHAFPSRTEHLFGFNFKPNGPPKVERPGYSNVKDWETEIQRQRARCWRADRLHKKCFVIPRSVINREMISKSSQFVDDRVPMWCFTYCKGSTLVRMAYLKPDGNPQAEKDLSILISAINRAHTRKNGPVMEDLGKLCPTTKDLKRSCDKLRELCAPMPLKEFWNVDRSWSSQLEDSKWLYYVATCLQIASRCTVNICDKGQTVIISEYDSRDFCCVISCLTQILIDPHFRTIDGFECLVQREWVAAGHRFSTRLGLLNTLDRESEESPVFLLFLDCVWQLLQQFPSFFQFSETYLTVLWDSANTGLYRNFIFDDYQMLDEKDLKNIPSVWDWSLQFREEDQSLLYNPLFVIRADKTMQGELDDCMKYTGTMPSRHYVKRLNVNDFDVVKDFKTGVIKPVVAGPLLKFWSQCYLRWSEPTRIIGGGNPVGQLVQCHLVDELFCLKQEINCLMSRTPYRKPTLQKDLYLGGVIIENGDQSASIRHQKLLKHMSSSFPFSLITGDDLGNRGAQYLDDNIFHDESAIQMFRQDLDSLQMRASFLDDVDATTYM